MPTVVNDTKVTAANNRKLAFGDWCITNCDGFKAAM